MSTTLKMTKQGLRDLNSYGPRAKVAAPEAALPPETGLPATVAAEASTAGEVPAVAEAASGGPEAAASGNGGGVS